ncbi:MAG: cytoplasmic protein [Syntrophus sp. (in: bacteria)]|nr:cytoplasmic protein [Syntrophus sp. (in: bacteria)]
MFKNDLIVRNPLRRMGSETDDVIPEGGFGAVLAHAGVGKTALLVQLALNAMLRDRNVLHISLNDPVGKVSLWYQELFHHLAKKTQVQQMHQLWEAILPHRFILTYKAEGFSVPRLEERLTDLSAQDIFHPQMIIMDGLRFDESGRQPLCDLKAMAVRRRMRVWFTVNAHRHEQLGPDGLPVQLLHVADLFDIILELQPRGSEIHIRPMKGSPPAVDGAPLLLDPSTMLIRNIG